MFIVFALSLILSNVQRGIVVITHSRPSIFRIFVFVVLAFLLLYFHYVIFINICVLLLPLLLVLLLSYPFFCFVFCFLTFGLVWSDWVHSHPSQPKSLNSFSSPKCKSTLKPKRAGPFNLKPLPKSRFYLHPSRPLND